MDRDKAKLELERLIAEAPQIAPSITRFDETRSYGRVTDENLDVPSFIRWELESGAAFQALAAPGAPVFTKLRADYLDAKEAAKEFHSRSILVHHITMLLSSALHLLDSPWSELPSFLERTATDSTRPTVRTLEEFRRRKRLLENLRPEDAQARLSGFLAWADGERSMKQIVNAIEKAVPAGELLAASSRMRSPDTQTPEALAAVGLFLMREVAAGEELWRQAHKYGIMPSYSTNNVQAIAAEPLNRYIYPAIDHLEDELVARVEESTDQVTGQIDPTRSREPVKLRTPGNTYVHPQRIEELEPLSGRTVDLTKLLELLREINVCHEHGCLFAIAALVRIVLDHVPPIFGYKTFSEVANNYPGTRSFKQSMGQLDNAARTIADQHLHAQARKHEALPTGVQVDFSNHLDFLLSEIVIILRR